MRENIDINVSQVPILLILGFIIRMRFDEHMKIAL